MLKLIQTRGFEKFGLITLILYVVSLPLSMAGMEFFGTLAALIGFIIALSSRKFFVSLGPDIWIWLFWLVVILGAVFIPGLTTSERVSIASEGRWILLSYGIITLLHYHRAKMNFLLKVLIFTGAVVGVMAIVQVFTGIDPLRGGVAVHKVSETSDLWRAKGFFRNPMTFAYSFGMLFCIATAYFYFMRDNFKSAKYKKLLLVATLIIFVAVIMSFTRGLWLGLVAAAVLMTFRIHKRAAIYVLGAFIFITIAVSVASTTVRDRVVSIVSISNVSNFQRFDVWHANWLMALDHPILGVGFSRNDDRILEYYERFQPKNLFKGHAHSNYFQVLAGNGFFGFFIYAIFMLWFFIKAMSPTQKNNPILSLLIIGSFGAQIVFHVGGLTESTFIDNEIWHLFMFIWCLLRLEQFHVDRKATV